MEDLEFLDDDVLSKIDFDNLLVDFFDSSSAETLSNPSPDSVSPWIGEIETMLMKDNDEGLETNQQLLDDFLSDILIDSPDTGGEVADLPADKDLNVSDESDNAGSEKEKAVDGPPIENVNNDSADGDADGDDPIAKKRRRQLKNRDAAVRSRERKKMYVKDLEMKSRYLEGECRRLGRLLQCVLSENQSLRLSLQKGNAFGASSAKQESAVLLLESLLLGSLLWFLGIMCLFTLPKAVQSNLESVPLEPVEEKAPGNLAERERGNRAYLFSAVNSRRCRASRTKMKMRCHIITVLG